MKPSPREHRHKHKHKKNINISIGMSRNHWNSDELLPCMLYSANYSHGARAASDAPPKRANEVFFSGFFLMHGRGWGKEMQENQFSVNEPPGETSTWTGLSVNKVQQPAVTRP